VVIANSPFISPQYNAWGFLLPQFVLYLILPLDNPKTMIKLELEGEEFKERR
jgi:hypothetical protein